MKERVPCEAEVHHPTFLNPDGSVAFHWGLSEDHFTPKCIVRRLKLDKRLLRSPENIIHSHPLCHALKDRVTPEVLQECLAQQGGRVIRFGEHKI